MFLIKRFNDESSIQHLKSNIIAHTYELKFDIYPRKIGLYSKIIRNIISIKNVCEEEDRGGPICLHFYGVIFLKRYLLGIICPQMWYTLLTFGIWFVKDEYFHIKIIALIVWIFICLSNIDSINYIRDKLTRWMN